jgi:hypothetical protein
LVQTAAHFIVTSPLPLLFSSLFWVGSIPARRFALSRGLRYVAIDFVSRTAVVRSVGRSVETRTEARLRANDGWYGYSSLILIKVDSSFVTAVFAKPMSCYGPRFPPPRSDDNDDDAAGRLATRQRQ